MPWTHALVFSITALWLILLTALHIHGWLDRRAMILTTIPQADATEEPLFPSPIPTASETYTMNINTITFLVFAIAVAFIALYFTIKLLFKLKAICQNAYKHTQYLFSPPQGTMTMDIFLRISDGTRLCNIYLTTILYEPAETTVIQTPACINAAVVQYNCLPSINMVWVGEFAVLVNEHPMTVQLPSSTLISNNSAAQLRQILASDKPLYSLIGKPATSAFASLPRDKIDDNMI